VQLSLVVISLHSPVHYSFGHIHMLFTIIARFLLMSFFVIISVLKRKNVPRFCFECRTLAF
jgi:hypothetical protein